MWVCVCVGVCVGVCVCMCVCVVGVSVCLHYILALRVIPSKTKDTIVLRVELGKSKRRS